MINTFWNLCRTCPANADDKVHTEYERNYTWHPVHQNIVKSPPEPGNASIEPVMPRKKKYLELAYRSNQVLKFDCEGGDSSDSLETVVSTGSDLLRARSEERSNVKFLPGPRSRSADPSLGRSGKKALMTQSFPPAINLYSNRIADEVVNKTTEYRSQFAWPVGGDPRKSVSMGTIAATQPKEEVPIVANSFPKLANPSDFRENSIRRKVKKTEYKAKFRPFSSYLYIDGNWRKPSKNNQGNSQADPTSWYTEVVERIKKADEYKSRAHGRPLYGDMTYPMPTRDAELWSHSRDRSSLLALSLASSPRPPGRDEKLPERPKTAFHKSSSKKESRPISVERKKSPSEKRKPPEKEGPRPKSAEPPQRPRKPNKPIISPVQHKTAVNGPSEEGKNPEKRSAQPGVHHRTKPTERISPQKEHHQVNTPRAVTRPTSAATPAAMVNGSGGKIWLKPSSSNKETTREENELPNEENPSKMTAVNGPVNAAEEDASSSVPHAEKDHHTRPSSLPAMNGVDSVKENGQDYSSELGPSPLPEPHTGPVPLTTVKSPEELTGVKSPDPECWTVPLETSKGLEWTDGHTPVEAGRVKSPPLSGSFQPLHSQTLKGESLVHSSETDRQV